MKYVKALALLLLLSLLIPTFMTPTRADVHAPIEITGDDQFTADNGVVSGTGTADDPYIIEGWEIDAAGGTGIRISGTTKYFIIRNCTITNADVGIELENLRNGVVYNSTITADTAGIRLDNATETEVRENEVHGENYGIYLKDSSFVTVHNNTLFSSFIDLLVENSHNSTITSNTFDSKGMFNRWSCDLTVEDNTVAAKPVLYLEDKSGTVVDEEFGQLIIVNSTDVRVRGSEDSLLNVTDVYAGIQVVSSNGTSISYVNSSFVGIGVYMFKAFHSFIANFTAFQNEEEGIMLDGCGNVTIVDSTFDENAIGIWAKDSESLQVQNDEFTQNWFGLYMENDVGSTVRDNTFSHNTVRAIHLSAVTDLTLSTNSIQENEVGIYASSLSSSCIFNNTIAQNGDEGLYLYLSTGNSIWNNTFLYNHQHDDYIGVRLQSSSNNVIYFNNFYDNVTSSNPNIWSSTIPLTYYIEGQYFRSYMGNFWWDYAGADADGNYIGDVAYDVDADEQDGYPLVKQIGNYTIVTGIGSINATTSKMPFLEHLSIAPGMTDLSAYRRYMYAGHPNGIAKLMGATLLEDIPIPRTPEHLAALRGKIWYSSGTMLYSTAGDAVNVGSNINDLSHGKTYVWLATDEGIKYYNTRTGALVNVKDGMGRLVDVDKYGRVWFVVDDKLVEYRRSTMTEHAIDIIPQSISVGRRGVWAAFGDRLGYFNGAEWTWYNDTDAVDVAAGRRMTWFITPTGFGYVKDGEVYEFEAGPLLNVEIDWRRNTYFLTNDGVEVAGRRGSVTVMDLYPPLTVQSAYWPSYVLADWKVYRFEDGNGTAIADGSLPLVGSRAYVWTAFGDSIIQIRVRDGEVTEIPIGEEVKGLAYSRYGLWFYTETSVGLYDVRKADLSLLLPVPGIKEACADRRGNFWFITEDEVGMVTSRGGITYKALAFNPEHVAPGRRAAVWIADDEGRVWKLRAMAYDPELVLDLGAVPKDMVVDWKGNVWLAFDDFTARYDTRRDTLHIHPMAFDGLSLDWRGRVVAYEGSTVYLLDLKGRL